jgi:transcriptional regulator with XRE-family HTH domain
MTPENARQLGDLIRQRREALGLTLRQLEELSGVDDTAIVRLESATQQKPTVEKLQRLASALDLPVEDLLITAGVQDRRGLPTFRPYLRAKYPQLPATAQAELDQYLAQVAERYGIDLDGPTSGEDEAAAKPKKDTTKQKGGKHEPQHTKAKRTKSASAAPNPHAASSTELP